MRDFSRRCEPGIYAFIARGECTGVVVQVISVAWHHVNDGFTWQVNSSFLGNFTCADSCLTPISGVDVS